MKAIDGFVSSCGGIVSEIIPMKRNAFMSTGQSLKIVWFVYYILLPMWWRRVQLQSLERFILKGHSLRYRFRTTILAWSWCCTKYCHTDDATELSMFFSNWWNIAQTRLVCKDYLYRLIWILLSAEAKVVPLRKILIAKSKTYKKGKLPNGLPHKHRYQYRKKSRGM